MAKGKLKVPTVIEELILTILVGQRELYGLQISEAIESATTEKKIISFGSLYPALRRLEQRGLLESRWENDTDAERGGARRRYYKITEDGKALLSEAQDMRNHLRNWTPSLA